MDPMVLRHIASQTKSNLELLASQEQLVGIEYHNLLDRLTSIASVPTTVPLSLFPVGGPKSSPTSESHKFFHARAVWGYNEHG